MVVFLMGLEVFGQVADSFCENGDLNFGGTRIARLRGIFLDERGFALGSDRHRLSP